MATLVGYVSATFLALTGIALTVWWLGAFFESRGLPWWIAVVAAALVFIAPSITWEIRRTRKRALLGLDEPEQAFITGYDRWWILVLLISTTFGALAWVGGRAAVADAMREHGNWVAGDTDGALSTRSLSAATALANLIYPSSATAEDEAPEPVNTADTDAVPAGSGESTDQSPDDPQIVGDDRGAARDLDAAPAGPAPTVLAPGGATVAAPGGMLPAVPGPNALAPLPIAIGPRPTGVSSPPGQGTPAEPAPTTAPEPGAPPALPAHSPRPPLASTPPDATPPDATPPETTPPGATPPAATPPETTLPGATPPAATPPGPPLPGLVPALPRLGSPPISDAVSASVSAVLAAPRAVRVPGPSGEERVLWPSEAIPDPVVLDLPSSATVDLASLTDHIATQLSDPYDRVRAVHDWIALNFRLDTTAPSQVALLEGGVDPAFAPAAVFARRSGPAEGLANVLTASLVRLGFEAVTVRGTTSEGLRGLSDAGHAWTAVRIGDRWHLADVALAVGCYPAGPGCDAPISSDWLFAPPEAYARDHVPDLAAWQLLASPIPRAVIAAGPQLTAPFFAHGLRWLAPRSFSSVVSGRLLVRIDGVSGTPPRVSWWHALRTYPSRRCTVSGTSQVEYMCDLPGPGLYRIHVRGPGSSGSDTSYGVIEARVP